MYSTPEGAATDVTELAFEQMRRAMVTGQLRTTAVNDPRVVHAMATVPRERFVPKEHAALAYRDLSVPLGRGRALPAPMVTGRLLTEARTRPADLALVIGAASGYAAAVLGHLVTRVIALEEDESLAAISPLPGTVRRVTGPLADGWAPNAPYDLILIDGAIEQVPDALVAQLADGGRLATGLLANRVTRLAIGRKAGGTLGLTIVADADVPVLPGFARETGFRF